MESDLPFDFNSIKEEEFDKFVDYIVLDQPPDPNNPNRAESSLPRNLKLKKIGKKVYWKMKKKKNEKIADYFYLIFIYLFVDHRRKECHIHSVGHAIRPVDRRSVRQGARAKRKTKIFLEGECRLKFRKKGFFFS